MTTINVNQTLQYALNNALPPTLPDAMRSGQIGYALSPVKVTLVGLASATSFDITTAAVKAAATIVGIDPALPAGTNLPAIGHISSVRVTAGAAAAGPRQMTDVGGTASATVATVSDDGTTITFEAGVTAFVLSYFPRMQGLTSTFKTASP